MATGNGKINSSNNGKRSSSANKMPANAGKMPSGMGKVTKVGGSMMSSSGGSGGYSVGPSARSRAMRGNDNAEGNRGNRMGDRGGSMGRDQDMGTPRPGPQQRSVVHSVSSAADAAVMGIDSGLKRVGGMVSNVVAAGGRLVSNGEQKVVNAVRSVVGESRRSDRGNGGGNRR